MGILRSDRVSGLGGANAINGSAFFGGSLKGGSYLRVDTGSTTDFTFGTGDFTIEFWVYPQSIAHQQHFFDNRGSKFEKGSSPRRISGSCLKRRAIAILCFCPPESFFI